MPECDLLSAILAIAFGCFALGIILGNKLGEWSTHYYWSGKAETGFRASCKYGRYWVIKDGERHPIYPEWDSSRIDIMRVINDERK